MTRKSTMLKEIEPIYHAHYPSSVFKLISSGEKISNAIEQFGITLEIFNDWCEQYPEFNEAVRTGMIDFHYGKLLSSRLENDELWKPLRSASELE